jgi:hypothetical protein
MRVTPSKLSFPHEVNSGRGLLIDDGVVRSMLLIRSF